MRNLKFTVLSTKIEPGSMLDCGSEIFYGTFDDTWHEKFLQYIEKVLTIGCIVLVAHCGLDRASVHGNIASAASRVKTHGVHH